MRSSRGTPSAEKRETPKETTQGGRAGRQRHHRRVTKTQTPFPPIVCSPLCGVGHTESPANSLREVSQVSLQLTAEGRGLSGDRYQFWGWCPFPVRPPRGRIHRRYLTPLRSFKESRVQPPGRPKLGVTVKLEIILECHRQQVKCQSIGNTVMDRKMSGGEAALEWIADHPKPRCRLFLHGAYEHQRPWNEATRTPYCVRSQREIVAPKTVEAARTGRRPCLGVGQSPP